MYLYNMYNITRLKGDFQEIVQLNNEIMYTKLSLQQKIEEVKNHYSNLVSSNTKKIFFFCLDSLYFQYKMLNSEMEHYIQIISTTNNRMYGDYYKLYNIITSQCKENNIVLPSVIVENQTHPVYKDLEPFLEYSIEDVENIHKDILLILNELYTLYVNKYKSIEKQNESYQVGFSITNYFNTMSYENNLLKEQINLYSNYLNFYHSSQKRYFTKIMKKVNEFMKELTDEVLIDHRTFQKKILGKQTPQVNISGSLDLSNTQDISLEELLKESEILIDGSEYFIKKIEYIIEDSSGNIEI